SNLPVARQRPRVRPRKSPHPCLEHDAEKCEAVFGRHHALFLDLDPDSDFRPAQPKIIRIWGKIRLN
ncbi:hypothetical protein ACCS96_52455, partial [Rhizobium ruizarguesonis]